MSSAIFLPKAVGKGSTPLRMASLRMRSTVALTNNITADQIKSFEEIPGPKPFPLIGNAWRFLPGIGEYKINDIVGTQSKMRQKFGDIVRVAGIPGRPDLVFIFNPKDTESIYRNEGVWPHRPGNESFAYYYKNIKGDVTGGRVPVLAGLGEEWQTLRSAVQQPIMQPRTARMYISSVEQVTNEFVQRIRSLRNGKNEMPEDFHNELYKWSLESIGIIALDTRLGCLAPNLSPESEPQKLIDAVQVLFDVFITLEIGVPLWKLYKTSSWKRFEKAMDTFTDLSVKYIYRAVESLKNRSSDNEEDLTLIQRLLKRDPDPRTALLAALDLLFAGIDTTSLSSANLLFLLAKNPDKQQKLYEEICEILPTKDTPVTDQRLNDMKYMRACLKESLRLAPVAPSSGRILAKDTVLSGYNVPKGVMVLSAAALMGNDSNVFPLADKYLPERWLRGDDTGCPITKEQKNEVHPFASVPFGHGPRMCLGRRFAEMEIQMLVLKAIQNFEVEFNYDAKFSSEDKLLFTLDGPLRFTFKDRK